MYALECMLDDDQREQSYRYYVTACLARIANTATIDHGGEWSLPSFYEMMNPESVQPEDTRSGAEIRDYILSRLE